MWALVVCGLAAAVFLASWRRSGQPLLDFFELRALRGFARVWHNCRVQRPAPLPPAGPAIVVANHPSQADPAFLLSGSSRPLHFLQAGEYYDVPLLRRLFARIGCIPVQRDGHDVGAVRTALRHLERGQVLAIFPEGDVNHGRPRPHSGAALLALRSHAPIIPARLEGGPIGRTVLGSWLWPSGGVRVTFGDPVDLSTYSARPIDHAVLHEVTDLLMSRIATLRPSPGGGRR